ncbi:MAG TPA: hypothetical protein PLL32_04830 [Anaeromyxobacteraceae bacterium]|nr:hypothetical protein [Anaeromyxobacteraceae bacterium]
MERQPFRVQDGSVRIYRILDVADGIDLARAEAAATPPTSRVRLAGSRSALEVAHPPLRLRLGERRLRIAGEDRAVEVQASLFDYGVVSVLFELPIAPGTALDALVPLAEALLERPTPELDGAAREVAAELSAALAPALHRPHDWEGMETYTVYFVRALDRRVTGEELAARAPIDRLLLGETDPTPLSAGERADVLKHRFAYLETDLAVVDWNSAFVHEPSGSTDVPDLLELATAQLLELRWYDAFLDRELTSIRDEADRAGSAGLFTRRYNRISRRTAALLVELSETVERVENAVKIVGDFYLARLYQAATRRFRLPAWQESVLRKHRMLAEVNRVLADGADVRRAELLELTIIALIAWEILWAFWRP